MPEHSHHTIRCPHSQSCRITCPRTPTELGYRRVQLDVSSFVQCANGIRASDGILKGIILDIDSTLPFHLIPRRNCGRCLRELAVLSTWLLSSLIMRCIGGSG